MNIPIRVEEKNKASRQPQSTKAQIATFVIPLSITVSIGGVVPPGSLASQPKANSADTLPTQEDEGLFSRSAVTAERLASFSRESLLETRFNWRAALSMAMASKLAYEEPNAIRNTALNSWGMSNFQFIEADDTQCFVVSTPNIILVTFRGTESLADWLANLNIVSTTRSYGTVHRGFLGAFQVVEPELRNAISGLPNRPVILTGHSLGGALATIAAAEWHGQMPLSTIYTYGQPGVGKGDFPSFVNQHFSDRFFRFVNDDDIVPRVPPTYRHVGGLYHFDSQGNLQGRPGEVESTNEFATSSTEPPMLTEAEFDQLRMQMLQQRENARAAGTESIESIQLEGIFPSVRDHAMEKYIAKIAAKVH